MKNFFALAIGAFCGTILRYGTGHLIVPLSNGFPMGTLLINLIGCLFLGWFLTIILIRWKVPVSVRLGIGTGFTGSFTTFSTFSVETMSLFENHREGVACVYLLASVMGGIALAAIGSSIARLQNKAGKVEGST